MGEKPSEKPSQGSEDVAFLHSATEDGKGARILRFRDGTVEAAEVRPAREGQPLNSQELVKLHPRENAPRVCDVEVLHENPQEDAQTTTGRVRVSNRAYRKNWDRIFASDTSDKSKKPKGGWCVN